MSACAVDQRVHHRRQARRRGVVGGVARPGHQRLGVVGGVEEAAVVGAEPVERMRRAAAAARVSQTASPVACTRTRKPDATQPWSSSTPAGAPATPSRETRSSRPSTRCTRQQQLARGDRGGDVLRSPSRSPASQRPVIASPFQAATTLSSRAGRTRSRASLEQPAAYVGEPRGSLEVVGVARAAGASSCRARRCRPAVTSTAPGRPGAVVRAEHLDELRRRPGVELALDALAVRVQRRGEAALGGAQLAEQEVGGLARDPIAERPARPARRGRAAGRCRRASSRSAAPPRPRRRSSARSRRRAGRRCRRGPSPRGCRITLGRAPRRRRNSRTIDGGNFGERAEAAVGAVVVPLQQGHRRGQRLLGDRRRRPSPSAAAQVLAQLAGHAPYVLGLVSHASTSASSTCRNAGCPCRGWSGK